MLYNVGRSTPLVVVFTGVCWGIFLCRSDFLPLVLCSLFLVFVVGKDRFFHAFTGIMIGCISCAFAPKPADLPCGEYLVKGTVETAGFSRGTYRVIIDDVTIDDRHIHGKIQLTIYKNIGELEAGYSLCTYATIKPIRSFGNFDEFDYRFYLLSKKIVLRGFVKDFNQIETTRPFWKSAFKSRFVSKLNEFARPEGEILKAVLTGDRSGLVYSLSDRFASLGIAHLIAISGLHMGIIMALGYTGIFMLLRIIPAIAMRCDTPFIAKIGGLLCAFLYAIFVGATIPTIRAVIMASCVVGSLFFLRRKDLLEGLACAGVLILSIWPYSIYSVSFALSFSAVLGIIAIYIHFEKYPNWLLFLLIPVGATVFTTPVVVFIFGFISSVGIISNLVFVPFFSFVVMPVGIAA